MVMRALLPPRGHMLHLRGKIGLGCVLRAPRRRRLLIIKLHVEEGDPALHISYAFIKFVRLLQFSVCFHHLVAVRVGEVSHVIGLIGVDRCDLLLIKPDDSLSVLPQAEFELFVLRLEVSSQSVLSPLVPVALVAATIDPLVHPVAVLLVVLVLALVYAPISPLVKSVPVHVVFLPLTFIPASIRPLVNSKSANPILHPVSRVGAAI